MAINRVVINTALKQWDHLNVVPKACLHKSLGALVPNSRDRHEKQWRPDFTHHKTHPKMCFV